MVIVTIPSSVAERIKREAEKLGISFEEYLIEIFSQGLDPSSRAKEYIESAAELLNEAINEISRENIRQAAEKIWGATALAIKAYAYWKDKRRLSNHKELWEYKDKVAEELGKWVRAVFQRASSLHICFYEGWCTKQDVEDTYEDVKKLVEVLRNRILGQKS